MIIFKDIEIEGLGSIHNRATFKLDQGNSLNVIRGHVGAGKTTIPSGIYYALYGKILKEKGTIETWPELQLESYRGTYVKLNYDIDGIIHSVIRCKSFKSKITVGLNKKVKGSNGLYYLIDGELVTVNKGKGNIQTLIEKNLGYSMDLFKNSIIFGQKMKRIIEETGPQKKKVFEEAFEVGFIDEAKEITQKDKTKLLETQKDLVNAKDNIEQKLDYKEELYEQALDREANFSKEKDKRVEEYQGEIKELREELIGWKEDLQKLTVNSDTKSLNEKKTILEKELKDIKKKNNDITNLKEKELVFIEDIEDNQLSLNSAKPKICKECGGKLTDEAYNKKRKKWKEEIENSKERLKDIRKQLKVLGNKVDTYDIEVKITKINEKLAIIKYNEDQFDKLETKISKIEDKIKSYEDKIKELKEETLEVKSELYSKAIKRLTRNLKKVQKNKRLIDKEINLQDWLISDPLSNNGLKAYMFDNLLQNVNIKLDEYSKILGFQVEFGINLDSHRKEFYQAILKNDIVIPYEDLSGGQKQLIDTTVAFAIHDVISSIRPTNLLFLDEPFESLDIDNIEIVAELVQEKAKNKSLFLITHHQSFSPVNANYITISLDENQHTVISQ